jgi:hypothetical protein
VTFRNSNVPIETLLELSMLTGGTMPLTLAVPIQPTPFSCQPRAGREIRLRSRRSDSPGWPSGRVWRIARRGTCNGCCGGQSGRQDITCQVTLPLDYGCGKAVAGHLTTCDRAKSHTFGFVIKSTLKKTIYMARLLSCHDHLILCLLCPINNVF